jgi:hypothetical protein
LIEPQNQGRRFVSVYASKPLGRFSLVWPQNRWRQFLTIWPQNLLRRFSLVSPQNQCVTVFSSLASKLMTTVSHGLASKPVVGFLVEPQNQGGGGFPDLDFKIGSSGLMIWASKSPRRFLVLDLKTKQASVYRLRYKTDGERSAWDTRRDLAASLAWKQV